MDLTERILLLRKERGRQLVHTGNPTGEGMSSEGHVPTHCTGSEPGEGTRDPDSVRVTYTGSSPVDARNDRDRLTPSLFHGGTGTLKYSSRPHVKTDVSLFTHLILLLRYVYPPFTSFSTFILSAGPSTVNLGTFVRTLSKVRTDTQL